MAAKGGNMRRNVLILSILLLVSFLINSCTKKPANYYKKVDIGSRHEIIGKYSVSDNMANKVSCYHFIYDKNGKLIKIEYLKGGKLQNDSYFGVAQVIITP